jgi:hypothetical protein
VTLSILTYSVFIINTLQKYALDPLSFTHHPHKDLLKLADDIIHTKDTLGYKTHIGQVKSHTGVTHTDEAGKAVRNVVEGHIERDLTFTGGDPPIGGPRTWPQLRTTNQDIITTSPKLSNLHSGLRKLVKKHISNNPTNPVTIYGNIPRKVRDSEAYHTIHAYSNASYRSRRDSL